MIERYTRPEMGKVWSEQNKYDKWLLVEIAASEAWCEDGVVPEGDMAKLRDVTYDYARLKDCLLYTSPSPRD